MDLYPGDLVLSKAGRDKGKIFIVITVQEPDYVRIADGELRRVEKPKLKKKKHVKYVGRNDCDITKIIQVGGRVSNSDVRKVISSARNNGYV